MSFIVLDAVRAAKDAVLAKLAELLGNVNAAGKPLRITVYTAGAGVHNILPESTHQIITLVGAGGDGSNAAMAWNGSYNEMAQGQCGNSGEELHRRISLSGAVAYEVGAAGNPGGKTKFGTHSAAGGSGGYPANLQGQVTPRPPDDTQLILGKTAGKPGTWATKGGDSTMGVGGAQATSTTTAKPGSGYGAGGGGGSVYAGFTNGGKGSTGYIRIEEY